MPIALSVSLTIMRTTEWSTVSEIVSARMLMSGLGEFVADGGQGAGRILQKQGELRGDFHDPEFRTSHGAFVNAECGQWES